MWRIDSVASNNINRHKPRRLEVESISMVSLGSLAMIFWKLGQARKGAAEAVELCEGGSLMETPPEMITNGNR